MKIKGKIIAIGIICLGLIGCSNGENVIDNKTADACVEELGTFEWISPDGVHYWVYNGVYRYGMAPRYDSNGNLVIEENK